VETEWDYSGRKGKQQLITRRTNSAVIERSHNTMCVLCVCE